MQAPAFLRQELGGLAPTGPVDRVVDLVAESRRQAASRCPNGPYRSSSWRPWTPNPPSRCGRSPRSALGFRVGLQASTARAAGPSPSDVRLRPSVIGTQAAPAGRPSSAVRRGSHASARPRGSRPPCPSPATRTVRSRSSSSCRASGRSCASTVRWPRTRARRRPSTSRRRTCSAHRPSSGPACGSPPPRLSRPPRSRVTGHCADPASPSSWPRHRSSHCPPGTRPAVLVADIDGRPVRRAYSASSAPGASRLEVTVKHIEGGRFSAHVHRSLRAGDRIAVRGPSGPSTPSRSPRTRSCSSQQAVGSGVAPDARHRPACPRRA
ncbi:FAD-binding oxidoreductase [Streptomyces sp. V4I2]|uniref:FAD-binding oxidoreductase n=1 Tax=Streptomyces sp. V4I2 TaxID=3042280 RepID=UPI0027D7A450|nr:FAD-binding oxidoreductase [Streptomyces sp. V4I2]